MSTERTAIEQLESAAGGRGRWAAPVTPKVKVAIGLLHKASLVSPYTDSRVDRQYVPTSKISWKVSKSATRDSILFNSTIASLLFQFLLFEHVFVPCY